MELPAMLSTSEGIVRLVLLVGGEILALVLLGVILLGLNRLLLRRLAGLSTQETWIRRCEHLRATVRGGILLVVTLVLLAVLVLNGWYVWQGRDAVTASLELLQNVPVETWRELGLAVLAILGLMIAARFVLVRVRRLLSWLELRAKSWQGLKANDQSIEAFFRGLASAIVNTVRLLVLTVACTQLLLPESVGVFLVQAVTIYLTVAVGILVIRMTAVIVDTLDAMSRTYAENQSWATYYRQLRPLIPTFRRCLEYALWVLVGTLVLVQLEPVRAVAEWGPRLMTVIGIFFLGRVAIEVGYLFLDRVMLGRSDLSEQERRRRETILPLMRSVFRAAALFVVAVLMLDSLQVEVMPFLAGAGILGMVLGLGAQPLIHDVVSGFFIIFENIYLVGDFIEGGGARGTVEAIDFRTTRIRDAEGRLHVLRNGDMRQVINYSKDYTHSLIEVRVAYDEPIDRVLEVLRAVGVAAAAEDPDILAPTEVPGIVAFNESDCTVRTVTRVKPACHFGVGTRLRLRIKRAFDEAGIRIPPLRREVHLVGGPRGDESGGSPASLASAGTPS